MSTPPVSFPPITNWTHGTSPLRGITPADPSWWAVHARGLGPILLLGAIIAAGTLLAALSRKGEL